MGSVELEVVQSPLAAAFGVPEGDSMREVVETRRGPAGESTATDPHFVLLDPVHGPAYGDLGRSDLREAIEWYIPNLATASIGRLRLWFSAEPVWNARANRLADGVTGRWGYRQPGGWRGPVAVTSRITADGVIPPLNTDVRAAIEDVVALVDAGPRQWGPRLEIADCCGAVPQPPHLHCDLCDEPVRLSETHRSPDDFMLCRLCAHGGLSARALSEAAHPLTSSTKRHRGATVWLRKLFRF